MNPYLKRLMAVLTVFLFLSLIAMTRTTLFIVDHFMKQWDPYPHTYREWLMQTVPGPRLIIESGSNGRYSINSEMLAETFEITPIMIAYSGNDPLLPRVRRIVAHAKSGDVILLPFEWTLYTRDPDYSWMWQIYDLIHYTKWIDQGRYLSGHERLNPPLSREHLNLVRTFSNTGKPSWMQREVIFTAFWQNEELLNTEPETDELRSSLSTLANRYGDTKSPKMAIADGRGTPHLTQLPLKLGEPFLIFLAELSAFAKENPDITILFTPPANSFSQELLDSPEYQASQVAFMAMLLPMLADHGFTMIGNIEDSAFNLDAYGDASDHITAPYRDLRTERLIEHLKPYLKERSDTI